MTPWRILALVGGGRVGNNCCDWGGGGGFSEGNETSKNQEKLSK